jgi:uncharacterized RDD family membrane protein YckC
MTGGPGVPGAPPDRRGQYAGFVSRFVAYVVDIGVASGVFTLALAAASFAASVVTGKTVNWDRTNIIVAGIYIGWLFIYFAYSWAVTGKTFGMALLGVRVVRTDGDAAGVKRAVVRTLALPLSFLLLGLGFLGILTGRQRRALHDVIAGTVVVYTWNAHAARLRFLARGSGLSRPLSARRCPASARPRPAPRSPVPLACRRACPGPSPRRSA